MMAAQDLPAAPEGADVPEWIHLAPAGPIETFDRRGPYEITDPQAVIDASFAPRGEIEIDVNHATFTAAPQGGDAPARGWITEMQARPDGIWGRVRWTEEGRRLVATRAYRRISPVFALDRPKGRRVVSILNASLVNRQNLRGLAALNQEKEDGGMPFIEKLAELLGLDPAATEADIEAAIAALKKGGETEAMQAQLGEIATALGVEVDGDIVAAAKAAKTAAPGWQDAVAELQAENVALQSELTSFKQDRAREKAAAFVDGEIAKGRVGVKPLREHYIAMHQEDPARVEKEIGALPILGPSGVTVEPPSIEGDVSLNAEQEAFARLIGVDPTKLAENLKPRKEAN
ncbi:hypothetical protein FGK63_01780 [Ruegeria sediminis]|uniref:Mu-like prophage I protein n=2 Tax=Ruegeria sediminis TaxID=2583820 RepID=A0ABY2X4P4_9RHOB|nr:hypothetical protein FGK63_01780 [Ruegeria sediminis]